MNRLWIIYLAGQGGYILGAVDSYDRLNEVVAEYASKGINVCYMECALNVLNRVDLQFVPAPLPK